MSGGERIGPVNAEAARPNLTVPATPVAGDVERRAVIQQAAEKYLSDFDTVMNVRSEARDIAVAIDRALASHDAATADRVRRETAEGIAAAIEAKYLGPNSGRGYDGRDGCRLKWIARRIARARSEGWDEGYRFALDNVSDPLVYADLTEYGTGWAGLIQRGGITIDINDQEKKP
jgi:hypothetical protein